MNRDIKNKPPLTEEELAAKSRNKALARKMAITLAIAGVILIGLDLLSKVDFSPILDAIVGTEQPNIKFEYADFEEDIMKDSTYLAKIRLMEYRNGGQITLINEEDYDLYDPAVNRMHTFFQNVIAGDLDGYNECFSEAYHKKHNGKRTEPFTMQRLYDMSIELIGEVNEKNSYLRHSYYLVSYKIQKNNGTFRNDMASDGTRPQVFELVWDTKTGDCVIEAVCLQSEFKGISYDN